MKRFILSLAFVFSISMMQAQHQYPHPMPDYTPTAENLVSRSEFQDMKFGMFIHWGIYSVLGDGEWIMHNNSIRQLSAPCRILQPSGVQCQRMGAAG